MRAVLECCRDQFLIIHPLFRSNRLLPAMTSINESTGETILEPCGKQGGDQEDVAQPTAKRPKGDHRDSKNDVPSSSSPDDDDDSLDQPINLLLEERLEGCGTSLGQRRRGYQLSLLPQLERLASSFAWYVVRVLLCRCVWTSIKVNLLCLLCL